MGRGQRDFFQSIQIVKRQMGEGGKMFNITNREMQIKTTMMYHLTPVNAVVQKTANYRW